jgi:hypothetical protein
LYDDSEGKEVAIEVPPETNVNGRMVCLELVETLL